MAAECGTVAGYHAHRRREEDACGSCKLAMAEDKQQKRLDEAAMAAASFEAAINAEPDIEPEVDELDDLRENLRYLRAAMRVSKGTRDTASLSKQRAEIVRRIKELEAEQNKSKGVLGGFEDELADVLRPNFAGRSGT